MNPMQFDINVGQHLAWMTIQSVKNYTSSTLDEYNDMHFSVFLDEILILCFHKRFSSLSFEWLLDQKNMKA